MLWGEKIITEGTADEVARHGAVFWRWLLVVIALGAIVYVIAK